MTGIPQQYARYVRPDGIAARLLLALLATAGLFYVNIMAAIVTGLQDGLGFTPAEANLVASANVYGAAAGALAAVLVVTRLPWRRTEAALIAGLITVDLLSTLVREPGALAALRLAHGVIGGLSVGIGLAIIARTRSPDKGFGMLLFVQYGLGGLGVMTIPGLVPILGHQILFLALALVSLAAGLGLLFLPDYPAREHAIKLGGGKIAKPLVVALLAVFLFQASNMGLGANIIDLGRHYGLRHETIAPSLGAASWLGMLGALLVAALGTRRGRVLPLALAMLVTLAGTWAFHGSANGLVYFAANVGTAVVWAFVIPYLFGICADYDATGRTAAFAGFCSKLGLASGPAGAGLLLATVSYDGLIEIAWAVLALSAIAALWSAWATDRLVQAASPPAKVSL
jgi:predicted MFS family arabinose efflux permease